MKKTCIILTILLAVLLLVACGAEDKKQTPTAPDKPESTVEPTKPVETKPVESLPAETPDDPVDPNFPTFEVGYYAGNEFIHIKSTKELADCLSIMANLCGEGKAFNGIGVHLYGYEVQKSDISGIPYCHLSYGTKDNLMTVMGFGHDVLGELDAHLVVELLRICPYFTKVEFFFVKDPTAPVR